MELWGSGGDEWREAIWKTTAGVQIQGEDAPE